MTPLELMILLHYYGCANDFRDGDFSAPAVRDAMDRFRLHESLLEESDPTSDSAIYRITERGKVFIRHLCDQPLPVSKWIMPNGAALSSLQGKGE